MQDNPSISTAKVSVSENILACAFAKDVCSPGNNFKMVIIFSDTRHSEFLLPTK
jgi:hypothetical protein